MSDSEATRPTRRRSTPDGIRKRHGRACRSRDGGRCNCRPSWQVGVWSARDGRRTYRTFATEQEAKDWRAEAGAAVRRGAMRARTTATVRAAWQEWITGAREGTIRTRSGDPYKPSTLRSYEAAMADDGPVMRAVGALKLAELDRVMLQDVTDRLVARGASASTVRNAIMPLRALYARALDRGEVAVNPTASLRLPAVRGARDRIADPAEAAALLAALPDADRALWATAVYAGLRRGELMALRWVDVDLAGGTIRVERSYDPTSRAFVAPKSRAGRRRVPLTAGLRETLALHRAATGGADDALVFARPDGRPLCDRTVAKRVGRAWKAAGLEPLTLHEARHTYASLMIAAGVGAKALSTYMGHSSITITLDRYGHLMPGNEDEAASLLDAYLARADTRVRMAPLGQKG